MKKQVFGLKGMMRDLAASKGSSQYAYEIRNLRLTAQEDSTLLALTTEKGNSRYSIYDEEGDAPYTIYGNVVGYCVVGTEYIVLFTHNSNNDYIYRLHSGRNEMVMKCTRLYIGNLGFTDSTELETIGIYENENIQKVYWIDGVHQPRVINIIADSTTISHWSSMTICPFDFMLKMELEETVTISKEPNAYGIFVPGTIQYVFSYHTKMGQQTPSFYVSPIYYTSPISRGASPEDSVNNAFNISISNIDPNFDYIDIYSIQRTSEDGIPICKKVVELKIKGTEGEVLSYIDNGLNTETVDYSEILYLGGTNIVPYTMEQKNNVLFFGNIKYDTAPITQAQKDAIWLNSSVSFTNDYSSEYEVPKGISSSFYVYQNQLDKNQAQISTFMSGESYYFGIILQDEYGVWSDVLPVGGYTDGTTIDMYERKINTVKVADSDNFFIPVRVTVEFEEGAYSVLNNYKKIKIVRLKESPSVLCQGIIAPTVYNKNRKEGLYAQSSWFFRPIGRKFAKNVVEWNHNHSIGNYYVKDSATNYFINGEIIGASNNTNTIIDTRLIIAPSGTWTNDFSDNEFFIDWNLITMHSPDIEFGNIQDGNYSFNIIGHTVVDKSASYAYLTLGSPVHSGRGLIKKQHTSNTGEGLLAPLWFEDGFAYASGNSTSWKSTAEYPLFTWARPSSLTTQREYLGGLKYASIENKCLSSLKFATKNTYKEQDVPVSTSHIYIYQEDDQPIAIERDNNNPDYLSNAVYQGSVDTILSPYGYYTSGYNTSEQEFGFEVSGDIIPMQYKSSKHAVMQLLYGNSGSLADHKQLVIPNTLDSNLGYYQRLFWSKRDAYPSGPTTPGFADTAILYVKPTSVLKLSINDGNNDYVAIAIAKEGVHKFTSLTAGQAVFIDSEKTLTTLSLPYNPIPINNLLWEVVDSGWTPSSGYEYCSKNVYYYFRPVQQSSGFTFNKFYTDTNSQYVEYTKNNSSVLLDSGGPYYVWSKTDDEDKSPDFDFYGETASYDTTDSNYLYLTNLTTVRQPLTTFNNTSWIVASDTLSIIQDMESVIGTIGDAYYQRFDCLKTYPHSSEDVNQVVEIMSFMCETRINIDGRYDQKRGLIDNTIVTAENFNLLNKGYTQDDNIFSASFLDSEDFNVDLFPNQITWTKQKIYGAHIDNWTHVVATSTLDMDGNNGTVKALKLWNDKLFCFQDNALALIKYNESVALSTTTGTPVELANSGRVEGKQYVSNTIGCSNKNTIQVTNSGLYFADSNTRELYRYRDSLEALSKLKGFNTYFYDASVNFDKLKTFYDPKLKDVYFEIYKQSTDTTIETLIYNEQLEEFISFMDYDMNYMFPYKDSLISIKNNELWKQFKGNYLSFYGTSKGYSIDLLCSENPTEDKTYTNIEFRADVFNGNTLVSDNSTLSTANITPFSKIKAWDEYQTTGDVDFSKAFGNANISQKFRIWRGDIPRVYNSLTDRIRNPWIRLKMWKVSDNNYYKTVIHDVCVSYV